MSSTGILFGVAIRDIPASDENGIRYPWYSSWKEMLRRVYSEEQYWKFPSYRGTTVCKEWLLASNFRDWYNTNFIDYGDESSQLDKDILSEGHKHYSPTTCRYIPARINSLFNTSDAIRGEFPCGVSKDIDKRGNTFFHSACERGKGKKYHAKFKTATAAELGYLRVKVPLVDTVLNSYVGSKVPVEVLRGCEVRLKMLENRLLELEDLLTEEDMEPYSVLGGKGLTYSQVRFVYETDFSGESLRSLGKLFGISPSAISQIKNDKRYTKFTQDFKKNSRYYEDYYKFRDCLKGAKYLHELL